jgi:hypothetical protein
MVVRVDTASPSTPIFPDNENNNNFQTQPQSNFDNENTDQQNNQPFSTQAPFFSSSDSFTVEDVEETFANETQPPTVDPLELEETTASLNDFDKSSPAFTTTQNFPSNLTQGPNVTVSVGRVNITSINNLLSTAAPLGPSNMTSFASSQTVASQRSTAGRSGLSSNRTGSFLNATSLPARRRKSVNIKATNGKN